MNFKFTRRTFLGGVLGALVATVFGLRHWQTRQSGDLPVERLLELVENRASAALLGQRYREAVPKENGEAALVSALASTLGNIAALPVMDADALRRLVDERIRHDFSTGQMVDVDGWLLAVTEARLCALASLQPDS